MAKGIRNTDAVVCKLRPASTRATNYKLEVAREEQYKKEKMVKR